MALQTMHFIAKAWKLIKKSLKLKNWPPESMGLFPQKLDIT